MSIRGWSRDSKIEPISKTAHHWYYWKPQKLVDFCTNPIFKIWEKKTKRSFWFIAQFIVGFSFKIQILNENDNLAGFSVYHSVFHFSKKTKFIFSGL
jgi:hypothetical protein